MTDKGKKIKEKLTKQIDESRLKELFHQNLSYEEIGRQLGVCGLTVSHKVKELGLKRDSAKVTSRSLSESKTKHSMFDSIKERIPKEEFEPYFLEHTEKECVEHWDISSHEYEKLRAYYGIKKDRVKVGKSNYKVVIEKYGYDNAYNWKKGWETRIKNFGSLEESYRQGYEKVKATCLERYGSECILNSDYMEINRKHKSTIPNKKFKQLLDLNGINDYGEEFVIKTKSYDFKVGNTLIEVNPTATHNSNWLPYGDHTPVSKKYHQEKSKLARENGYFCMHIWDWDDRDKIINLLNPRDTLYARNTEVREVEKQEAESYLNKYHLQNYARDSIRLGLYYNNELVSIMTFGKPRYNNHYEYELIRYCSHKNVVGGASKLFSHFISDYKPHSIISYCDNSKFEGKVYDDLGFKLKSEGTPSCHWHNPETNTHITDNLLRQRGFDQLFGTNYGKGTDNNQLMLNHGFWQVYDAGQNTYEWNAQ